MTTLDPSDGLLRLLSRALHTTWFFFKALLRRISPKPLQAVKLARQFQKYMGDNVPVVQ